MIYIHAKFNHPTNILKQLPVSIEARLSNLCSNSGIFHETSKHYQNVLNQPGHNCKLQYKPPNKENENRIKSLKNRKRNIIWFNPPFSKNVSSNIGKYFLLLIQKHFPSSHKYEIFNKNNVKISYSCMGNINSIINMHNREKENCHGVVKCNCINKPDCPLSNQYQITNVIYKAKFTSNFQNYYENIYYGTSEVTFKPRCGNHKKSFNHEKHRTDTELLKEHWRLKELRAQLQVQFLILKRCRPTKRTGISYLCLNKKLFIIEYQGNSPLNQRNELISKFRQKSKFKFMNIKPDHCVENVRVRSFFWRHFYSTFGLNIETYRVSPRIHAKCGAIQARPAPNANTFHVVDVKTLLC